MKREGNYIIIDIQLILAVAWVMAGPIAGLSIWLISR